jgi:ABC-type nitrate/sulfonate/bicarbonate transport system permease component
VTPVVATAAVIAAVELLVAAGAIDERAFPRPSSIARALYDEVQRDGFWVAVLRTLHGWAFGLGLAIGTAVPLGIAVGSNAWVYRSVRFIVDFIRPIPSIALLPLFILLFGIGLPLKTYIVALGAFWPLFFQTMYGVQDVDPVTRDTARAYKLNAFLRFVFVSLPGATPFIATGLRISASIALLLVVGTEMVAGVEGLGRDIWQAQ